MRLVRVLAAATALCLACGAGSSSLIAWQAGEAGEALAADEAAHARRADDAAAARLAAGARTLAEGLDGLPLSEWRPTVQDWAKDYGFAAAAFDPQGRQAASAGEPREASGSMASMARVGFDAASGAYRVTVEARAAGSAPVPARRPALADLIAWGAMAALCSALGAAGGFAPRRAWRLAASLACAAACAAACSAWIGSAQQREREATLAASRLARAAWDKAAEERFARALPRFAARSPGRDSNRLSWTLRMIDFATDLPAGSALLLVGRGGRVEGAWGPEFFTARGSPAPAAAKAAAVAGAEAASEEPCGALSMPCRTIAAPLAGGGALAIQSRSPAAGFAGLPPSDGTPWWAPPVAWCLLLGTIACAWALSSRRAP